MEVTVEELFQIIGELTVKEIMLKKQLALSAESKETEKE